MKRRNFLKVLTAAAATVALPARAMRDILIHKGNPAGFAPFTHDGTDMKFFAGATRPFYYQRDMLRQMNYYQQGARIHMNVARGLGKTLWHEMNFSEIEMRVLASLNSKQKRA